MLSRPLLIGCMRDQIHYRLQKNELGLQLLTYYFNRHPNVLLSLELPFYLISLLPAVSLKFRNSNFSVLLNYNQKLSLYFCNRFVFLRGKSTSWFKRIDVKHLKCIDAVMHNAISTVLYGFIQGIFPLCECLISYIKKYQHRVHSYCLGALIKEVIFIPLPKGANLTIQAYLIIE